MFFVSLSLYLVYVIDILVVSLGNKMLGFVYYIWVIDVYRVFSIFFILNIEFYICF